MTAVEMVTEWHTKFRVPILDAPGYPGKQRADLRVRLVNEEAWEFQQASEAGDLVLAADAIADLLYVVYGAALEWGIPIEEVVAEVHRSNMTKVWPDGTVHYREDGKVLKPPTYSPADVASVLKKRLLDDAKRQEPPGHDWWKCSKCGEWHPPATICPN